jgi:hypothetical protein
MCTIKDVRGSMTGEVKRLGQDEVATYFNFDSLLISNITSYHAKSYLMLDFELLKH